MLVFFAMYSFEVLDLATHDCNSSRALQEDC